MDLQGLNGKIEFAGKFEDVLRLCLSFIETAKVPILWMDSREEFILINRETCRLLGYSREEILSRNVSEIHPDYLKLREEGLIDRLRDHGSLSLDSTLRAKDGRMISVELTINYLKLDQGEYVFIIARDLTERFLAAKALRESEKKYRTLVENANDAIFIAQDGMIKFPTFHMPNPKFSQVTGYSPEEVSKAPQTASFLQFIHPDDQKMVLERHLKRLRGEEVPRVYSFRLLNKKGETVWVQVNAVVTTWEGRPATLNFLRDISHEKRLETQVYMAQKMEAVGTLAAGIAHDFNNLLMGIQGYVSLILFDGNGTALNGHEENLRRIEELVKSGSSLTSQLLGFGRRGKFETKPSDLNRIIERTADWFWRTKKEINHHKRFQEPIWAVEADRGQMEQVFLNLFVNAWQAMPGGGDLYIETRNVTLGDDYLKPYYVNKGNYVKVSITDTGVGMDKKTLQRIFEPFFTTKEMGRGTGLGLAAVYGIVKNHSGHINVYSEKGHGTTFTVYLPATAKEIAPEKKTHTDILPGKETILLVDDEEIILEVIAKALKMSGYNPLVAHSGKEAIEIYKKHLGEIQLVILDMIMPGMNGGVAYDHLKELNPAIKVILSSGYSMDGEASKIMEKGCDGFIQKPFGIQELSQKIREVLTS